MLELITDTEINIIKNYIMNYSIDKRGIIKEDKINVPFILREWNYSKQNLFNAGFKDKLILEKEICVDESNEGMAANLDNELKNNYKFHNIHSTLDEALYNIIYKQCSDYFCTLEILSSLLNLISLIKNKYEFSQKIEIVLKDGKKLKLNQGDKVLKILQKINNSYNIVSFEEFEYFKSIISNIKGKSSGIKGIMCLSIHPLDYMTMSDNDYNWSSCMSWIEDGSYRQGTVEMMNSSYIIVGYLKSLDDKNNFHNWNSKKWRELYIVNLDEKYCCNIKSYPYRNDNMTKFNIEWLQNIFFPNNNIYEFPNHSTFYIDKNDTRISCTFDTNLMYNDFTNFYKIFFSSDVKKGEYKFHELNYSGLSECMCCGELDLDSIEENCLVGNCCDPKIVCYECDEIFRKEDSVLIDGEWYCKYCVKEYFKKSDFSNKYYRKYKMIKIEVDDGDKIKTLNIAKSELKYFKKDNDDLFYIYNNKKFDKKTKK